MSQLFVGIDQGFTKTDVLVCKGDGHIVARGSDRGLRREGERYIDCQEQWLARALANALEGVDGEVTAVCGCLNGVDWPEDYDRLSDMVRRASGCEKVIVRNDCIGARRAATDAAECGIICVGSGVNAALQAADGREIEYGYFIESRDQGAHALVLEAWQCVVRAHNGTGPATTLGEVFLSHFGHSVLVELFIEMTNRGIMQHPKDLYPAVAACAAGGDGVARDLLTGMGRRLAGYITAAAQKLGVNACPVVLSGGALKGDGAIMEAAIRAELRGFDCQTADYEPVLGALLLLLDDIGHGHLAPTLRAQAAQWNLMR